MSVFTKLTTVRARCEMDCLTIYFLTHRISLTATDIVTSIRMTCFFVKVSTIFSLVTHPMLVHVSQMELRQLLRPKVYIVRPTSGKINLESSGIALHQGKVQTLQKRNKTQMPKRRAHLAHDEEHVLSFHYRVNVKV